MFYHSLYAEEHAILDRAKADLAEPDGSQEDWRARYAETVHHYEKLLRETIKLSRISDLQWQTLKNKEQEIHETNEKLQLMGQMHRHLVSDISHELKTPVVSIQGYVKAMIDGIITPDKPYLQMIYDKILLMNQLIKDLFQLSTLEANEMKFDMQPVLVSDWITQMRHELKSTNNQFEVVCSCHESLNGGVPETAVVHIDLMRISQVLSNLLQNAFKYTPEGRRITVEFKLEAGFAGTTDTPHADAGLRVSVTDTGSGIDERDLPLIFDRFYRGRQPEGLNVSGTGLGLAIVREILRKHGGQIGVSSKLGEGSTFYFTLPVRKIGLIRMKEESS